MLLGGLTAARADPTTQQRADALFAEGRKLIEAKDDAGACAKFDEAIKLDPDAAGTMLNLGLCNQNLKKYRRALYWFRKAQARAHETNLPEYEAAAGQRTKDLAALISIVKVQLSGTTPADAKVRIDGEEIARADFLHIEIDTGHHTLDARAAGHKSQHLEFDVEGKGGNTLTIDLPEGDDSIVIDRGAGRRKLAIITAAGGGALLVASGIVAYVARTRYYNCVTSGHIDATKLGNSCPASDAETARLYANDQQALASHWGTPLFIAGAVAVGAATYLYLTAPQRERIDRTVWMPALGTDSIGLAAAGTF